MLASHPYNFKIVLICKSWSQKRNASNREDNNGPKELEVNMTT